MINQITNQIPVPQVESGNNNRNDTGPSFSSALGDALNKVGDMEVESSKLAYQMAAGGGVDVHTVMIAGEKASLALQLTTQVRNKAIEAYQEIMRMQM